MNDTIVSIPAVKLFVLPNQRVFATELDAGHQAAVPDAGHGCAKSSVSPLIMLPVLDPRPSINSSKVQPVLSAIHGVPHDLYVVQSQGPPRCLSQNHLALVTLPPSKMQLQTYQPLTIYDHIPSKLR